MALHTYNPQACVLMVGTHRVAGFTDGEFVTVSYTDDAWTTEKGADGEITRNYNPSYMAEITITLKGSSYSNNELSKLHILDRASQSGVVPFSLIDTLGGDKVVAPQVWIKKMADVAKGTTTGDRTWVITAAECVMFVGGND